MESSEEGSVSPSRRTGTFKPADFESIHYRIVQQRSSIAKTGVLNLELKNDHSGLTSLKGLGPQPKLKKLIISGNPIQSLEDLEIMPQMNEIIADNTKIDSFKGLLGHPKLTNVSFINTPLSKRRDFRLALCILIGPHLSSINNKKVTIDEKKVAVLYPIIARELISKGWEVEYPIPSTSRFIELEKEYQDNLGTPRKSPNRENLYKKPALFIPPSQIEPEFNEDEEDKIAENQLLIEKITEKLQTIGVGIDFNLDCEEQENEIVEIVQNLASAIKPLANLSQELLNSNKENEEDIYENNEEENTVEEKETQ